MRALRDAQTCIAHLARSPAEHELSLGDVLSSKMACSARNAPRAPKRHFLSKGAVSRMALSLSWPHMILAASYNCDDYNLSFWRGDLQGSRCHQVVQAQQRLPHGCENSVISWQMASALFLPHQPELRSVSGLGRL